MATINVVCTRPLMMHGQRIDVGTVLSLAPQDAAAAVASGRATLQDQADRAAVNAAIVAERDRAIASCGRIPHELLRFAR